jgi:DNA-binding HxlR family transcriptional regulator
MRYKQFCALARAAEILGERWTLLIIRELLLGPQRFTELLGRLNDVSTSVLTERLSRLEESGVVERVYLPPPAASNVYRLSESGEALRPAIYELIHWGGRFLFPSQPGAHFQPDWLRLVLLSYARSKRSPRRSFELRLVAKEGEARFGVTGGPAGTMIGDPPVDPDVRIVTDFEGALALMSGRVEPLRAVEAGVVQVEGDVAALSDFPKMFDSNGGGTRQGR